MNYLFIGLATANGILLILTGLTGHFAGTDILTRDQHILAGLFVTIFTCGIHCIVFIYFLGTGKSIKMACEENGLHGDFAKQTKRLKGRAFPFALFGALSIMFAAITGGRVATGNAALGTHRLVVWVVIAWNFLCFFFEHKAICENMRIILRLAKDLPPLRVTEGKSS